MNDATTVCLDQFSEREGRKLNIMLFNVPESEKEDPEEKKNDDLEFLRILMAEIKLTVPFSQVIRIGVTEKTHSKPRPMRARTMYNRSKKDYEGCLDPEGYRRLQRHVYQER